MERKMLVSDYDGTLCSDIKNLKLNVEAIKEFRKQGNLFTISTGRTYKSIMHQIDLFHIPYDYLICCDGTVLFDNESNLLGVDDMSKSDILVTSLVARNEKAIKEITYYDPYSEIEMDKKLRNVEDNKIVVIRLKKKLLSSLKQYCKCIKSEMPHLSFATYGNEIFIKGPYNKKTGIESLEKILFGKISKENIITVGDNFNDLEMLREYDGYKMLASYPCMYGKGLKTTREVHTLIKRISKK